MGLYQELIVAASRLNVQTVILFVVVLLLTIAWIRRPRNLPPGPPAWPIIGNALGLQKAGGALHLVMTKWAKRYGRVMTVWMGPKLAVVLSDIEAVKEALVKQADCFSDRVQPQAVKILPTKGSIVMSNGEVWKERRRFGLSALRTLGMGKKSVEHKISEESRYLLESFDGEEEKPFDPEHAVMNAVSNIICIIAFGYRFEYSDPKFAHLIKLVKARLSTLSFNTLGILQAIFNRSKFLREGQNEINAFIKDIVQEHEESFDPNDLRDIIDMYLVEVEQQERSGKAGEDTAFCRTTLPRAIQDFFVAGTDTTTNSLLWLMLYMAIYPEVQNKVQKEIDDVIGSYRQPMGEDSSAMPYTNAVLMEMQRHRPVTPSAVPHQTRYQTELYGYTIPAKTVVFVNLWAILRDPKCWDDPEKFDPARFLSKDGKTVQRPEAFIPFSFGRRICMGENLAKMEMFLFFVNLLQRFTFSLPTDKPRPSLEGITGVTLGPHPYEIVAKKR